MKGGAAASPAPPLVDEFLERLRVEDGSSPLTIAAYRRDLRPAGRFPPRPTANARDRAARRPGRPPRGAPPGRSGPAHARPRARRDARPLPVRPERRPSPREPRRATRDAAAPAPAPASALEAGRDRPGGVARRRDPPRLAGPRDAGAALRLRACAPPSSSGSGRRTWTSRPRSSSAAASATGSGWSRSGTRRGGRSSTYLERARPRLVRGADPGRALREHPRPAVSTARASGGSCGPAPGLRASAAGSRTRSVTRSRAISSRAGPTSGRSRPCSDMPTSGRPRSTRTCPTDAVRRLYRTFHPRA